MRVLIFGGYDPDYARNRVLRIGLRRLGVGIEECRADARKPLAARSAELLARFTRASRAEVLLVPEFRHKDVPLARLLSSLNRSDLVVDPLISRYDTKVGDWGSVTAESLQAGHNRRIDRAAMRFADLLLCDTRAHARYFQAEFRARRERCAVVPVGFDDLVFQPQPEPPLSPFRVAFYGSFLPLHGVETILDAARRLRSQDIRWLLVGGGQTFHLVRAALNEGLQLEIAPRLAPTKLVQRLRAAHVLLGIFGTGEKAARVVPNKIFQGLGLERALVTGDTPAVREMFEPGEHLWTVPCGDGAALAESILRLRGDRAERRRLARAGAAHVRKHFAPECVAERFLQAGAEICGWNVA